MEVDLLKNFIDESALTMSNIRSLVDDYSIISYYLGTELELSTRYSSPLREGDENPSFSIFYGYGGGDESRLFFKDQSTGAYGDVFDFLQLVFKTDTMQIVLNQVNSDLGLNLGSGTAPKLTPTIIKDKPLIKERAKIKIFDQAPTKAYMDYWWNKYEIVQKYTDLYHTRCLSGVKYVYGDKEVIFNAKTLTISYEIGEFYKIYCPFESKEYKFRNNYPNNYVEGHMQIDWSRNDLLVITKATKECILFRNHWNIQAVSGKSETTMIPPHIMEIYRNHFKRIILWLDPDEAGVRSTIKYCEMYPFLEVAVLPERLPEKDPTDIFEIHRKIYTTQIVNSALKIA